jgi:hypothetical protein
MNLRHGVVRLAATAAQNLRQRKRAGTLDIQPERRRVERETVRAGAQT